MQQDKQVRKKQYRARGSRGGRRKKQHQTNASLNGDYIHRNSMGDQYPVYMPMPIYINNEQYVHNQNNKFSYNRPHMTSYVNQQQYYPCENYGASSNYIHQQNVKVDYSSLPPPLPLVQTSSSFSSQSTSSSYEHDPYLSEMNYHQQCVNNVKKVVKNQVQPQSGLRETRSFLKNLQLDEIDTSSSESNWPSLFSISPRSFLMGRTSNSFD